MLKLKRKSLAENPRQGRRWSEWSRAYRRQHPLCERCGWDFTEHVHHVVPVSVDPGRTYDAANVRGLCERCHAEVHRGEPLNAKPKPPPGPDEMPPPGVSMYERHGLV